LAQPVQFPRARSDQCRQVGVTGGLLEFLTRTVTLQPGDLMSTGTAGGTGVGRTPQEFLHPGDTVTVGTTGIGYLSNPVVAGWSEHIRSPGRERKIPKPGGSGKLRKLGIPTVADRVVQAALKLVLEPIFEADFEPASYGFRPKRRAQDPHRQWPKRTILQAGPQIVQKPGQPDDFLDMDGR
jgi:hypothetical protein